MKTRLIFLTLYLFSVAANSEGDIPVMVGGEEKIDACMSIGIIKSGIASVNGKLAVRSGPSESNAIIAEVEVGKVIWICDSRDSWEGIVYSDKENKLCNVSSPVFPRKSYAGSCKSGWIPEGSYEVAAG